MSSFDRLIVPAFTSPETETRTEWKYRTEVNEEWEKRLDDYEYVGIDGVEHKDLKIGDDKYPMACIFDGVNHDQDAFDFIQTLRETALPGSPGFLEHPRGQIIPVVVQKVVTNHNPAKDAGETIINVVFWRQLTLPSQQQESPLIAVNLQLEKLNESGATDFEALTNTDETFSLLASAQEAQESLAKVSQTMAGIVAGNAQALSTFEQIQADILNNLDTLVKSPLTLASQFQQMINMALGVPGTFLDKANGWLDLYSKSVGDGKLPDLYYSEVGDATKNRIAHQELASVAAISSNITNVVLSIDSFKTKQEAFDALSVAQQNILNLGADLDALQGQFETQIFQKQYFSTTSTYRNLAELSRIATAAIQSETSRLKTVVLVTLKEDTTILHLAWKYHKDVSDSILEFIIDSNGLDTDEILLLTAGSTIQI